MSQVLTAPSLDGIDTDDVELHIFYGSDTVALCGVPGAMRDSVQESEVTRESVCPRCREIDGWGA